MFSFHLICQWIELNLSSNLFLLKLFRNFYGQSALKGRCPKRLNRRGVKPKEPAINQLRSSIMRIKIGSHSQSWRNVLSSQRIFKSNFKYRHTCVCVLACAWFWILMLSIDFIGDFFFFNHLQGATIKTDERTGKIVIARVMHGGAADRSGLIHPGDEVIEVNGIDVLGKTPNDVLDILVSPKLYSWRAVFNFRIAHSIPQLIHSKLDASILMVNDSLGQRRTIFVIQRVTVH